MKCSCGLLITISKDLVEKANRMRKTLPANQYGSAGIVKCPGCGGESPLIVTAPLRLPTLRSWPWRRT